MTRRRFRTWLGRSEPEGLDHLILSEPGRYRFVLPVLPGYAPVEPQEVLLTGPQPHTHVIRLERLR